MSSRLIQNGAALAIAALIAVSVGSAIHGAIRHERLETHIRDAAFASVRFADQLGALSEAGSRLLAAANMDSEKTALADLFATAAPTPASEPNHLNLTVRGYARLRGLTPEPDLVRANMPGAAPEIARAFANAATMAAPELVREADAQADNNTPAPAIWLSAIARKTETDIGRFWMLQRNKNGGETLLSLIEITRGDGAEDFVLKDIAVEPQAAPLLLSDASTLIAGAVLGRQRVSVLLTANAQRLTDAPWARIAPNIAIALLTAFAVVLLIRANRHNVASFDERQQRIIKDITTKQRALEASEARFRHLAESTNVIPWTAELESQRFTYVGPQIEAVSGYPASAWKATGFWIHHIHPADRQYVISAIHKSAETGRYATLDYRIRAADGRIVHVRNMLSVTTKKRRGDGATRTKPVAQGFLLDITDTKNAAKTLEMARQKAEQANQVKSKFLASMSHELRTPLNAVIGFSEIMKDQLFGPLEPHYREYAENVHASGRHLLDLINDVLDLSKIEAGRIDLAEEPTDLLHLLEDCRSLLQERLQSAGLHHAFELAEDLPVVMIDERRMKQVILNLMSNAMKFTPPGGSVRVSCRREAARGVVIVVRDTGIGMDPEDVPKALANFGQIDGDLTRKQQGTGLGLPIAKSLVEMHGGKFEIESEKGKGTEIRVWLPESRFIAAA